MSQTPMSIAERSAVSPAAMACRVLRMLAAVMFGSTETTFYVIAVYFGAVNIKNTRHAIAAGLTADLSAMLIAVWLIRLLFI